MRTITYKPPQEVVAGAAADPLRRVMAAVLIATLVMILLGSKAFLAWSNDLPISQASDFLLYLAQGWQDAMDAIGLTSFADAIHRVLHWLQGVR